MKYLDDPEFNVADVVTKIETLRDRYAGATTLSGRLLFRPRATPPSRIYKYTSLSNASLILSNLSLRYTQSEVLDDIFEEAPCKEEIRSATPEFEDGPTLVVDVSDPESRLAMFDRVKEARGKMRRDDIVLSDDVAIITSNGLHRDWRYELGNRPLKETLEGMQKPLALSLTELSNDVKMWSGYGDSHRGVCLGFNSRSRYFRSNRDLIGKSGYFAPIEYRRLSVEDYAYRFPHERFFIKTHEWSEQREWRRIEFIQNGPGIDWKSAVFTFPFPPEVLCLITFGARCADEEIRSIIEKVDSQPSLSHVGFARTKMSLGQLIVERL